MAYVTIAVSTLISKPLDFGGNKERILKSIRLAKEAGATIRTGPELEISGYGCLDFHLEGDTFLHSWEVFSEIIADPICKGLLVDVGLGVRHRNVRYNCRVLFTYKKIFFIRPKMSLANDGLYREERHFTAWPPSKVATTEQYYLEPIVGAVTGQRTVPFGDCLLSTADTCVGLETCEELFTPSNPSTYMGLNGCEIVLNSSASHAELQKLRTRLDLIANSTRKTGGIYCYSNATGIDGEARMMFDGSSMIVVNGNVVAQGNQFSLRSVEVTTATVDIESVRSYRAGSSRSVQGASQRDYPRVECDLRLSRSANEILLSDHLRISPEKELSILDRMPEIWMSTAVYLWQYLIRSNLAGYILALSGGLDSATVAIFVFGMAKLVLGSIRDHDEETLADLRRITGMPDLEPKTEEEIVSLLLTTCFMGTVNSSSATRSRAKRLAERIGAQHHDVDIDAAVDAFKTISSSTLGMTPKFASEGGTAAESVSLQSLQARVRNVQIYNLAQLATTARKSPRAGVSLLVLGSSNADEALRGYLTKYDNSSADVAPLAGLSKLDAKRYLAYATTEWSLPILTEFLDATPSAELLPLSAGVQSDEEEMGLTYADLSEFGLLRSTSRLGPVATYLRLTTQANPKRSPAEASSKIKHFYRTWAMNRHKQTVLTPALHLAPYDPSDQRFDERPYLLDSNWPYQFGRIDKHLRDLEAALQKQKENKERQGKQQAEDGSVLVLQI